jgi:hypothetical protein
VSDDMGLDVIFSGQGTLEGPCKHHHKSSGSVNEWFIREPNNYQMFKKPLRPRLNQVAISFILSSFLSILFFYF